ncbi:MAG: OmpP1/FadL family transporter [Rhizomicrobium sp.]
MRFKFAALAVTAPFVIFNTAAHASGFALREASTGAMGTAYAGAAATNSDPSYMFYNPAATAGVVDHDLSLDVIGILPGSGGTFVGHTAAGTPTGGAGRASSFIGSAAVPSGALRYRLNDQWAVGLSLTVPWGETTHYPANWTGRYYAQTTGLTAYNATATVSYQITPDLTLAAGPQVQYTRGNLTQAIDFGTIGAGFGIPGAVPGADDGRARLHGHDWGVGYVAGIAWQALPDLNIGVSYRSEIPHALSGQEQFTFDSAGIGATLHTLSGAFADSGGKVDLPTPAVVNVGARWAVSDQWTALGTVEYTNWSSLKQLLVVSANPLNSPSLTQLNWKDTWFGSLGAEYRPDETWTLRGGIAYDEAAAPPATLEPRIPDADRYWVSAGVGYRWDDNTDINVSVSHLLSPHSHVDQSVADPGNAARGSLDGTTDSQATLVGLQLVLR